MLLWNPKIQNSSINCVFKNLLQGPPWQSVYFGVKILGRKKVLRIIYTLDFLFPEKHISFAITSFSRFLHFRKKVSWFQLFLDIFSKKFFLSNGVLQYFENFIIFSSNELFDKKIFCPKCIKSNPNVCNENLCILDKKKFKQTAHFG